MALRCALFELITFLVQVIEDYHIDVSVDHLRAVFYGGWARFSIHICIERKAIHCVRRMERQLLNYFFLQKHCLSTNYQFESSFLQRFYFPHFERRARVHKSYLLLASILDVYTKPTINYYVVQQIRSAFSYSIQRSTAVSNILPLAATIATTYRLCALWRSARPSFD